jgi:hypothetical protein
MNQPNTPSRGGLVHEAAVPATCEWYTPAWLFEALGATFDLDPCHPEGEPLVWLPAGRVFTKADNGLVLPWSGMVWLNPPYGKQTSAWLHRMGAFSVAGKAQGIGLVFARTGTSWFRETLTTAWAICFLGRRVSFVDRTGEPPKRAGRNGKARRGTPGADSMLVAWGPDAVAILERANLGPIWHLRSIGAEGGAA